MVALLLFMVGDAGRRGYGQLLDAFWNDAVKCGVRLPQADPVSAPAFCNARKKLAPSLLDNLLQRVCATIDANHSPSLLWHGRRVFAVDGCRINTQRSAELDKAFGTPHGGHCPQLLLSTLYDVIGEQPVAATIAPGASCERQELLKLLPRLRRGDVLVLDRGYPSHEVFDACLAVGVDLIGRVPKSGSFAAVGIFQENVGDDYIVAVRGDLQMRTVRISHGGDEAWYLLTTVRRSDFSRSQMAQLYHLRWEIEEFFKLLKSDYFSQRQFHAKTCQGVEQELRAQILFAAMARLFALDAAKDHEVSKHAIVAKSAILALAEDVVRILLLDDPDRWAVDHPRILRRIIRLRHKRRPNRSCPRRSFKPGPRWNSKGKVGG
jgi:hypothetical protein